MGLTSVEAGCCTEPLKTALWSYGRAHGFSDELGTERTFICGTQNTIACSFILDMLFEKLF